MPRAPSGSLVYFVTSKASSLAKSWKRKRCDMEMNPETGSPTVGRWMGPSKARGKPAGRQWETRGKPLGSRWEALGEARGSSHARKRGKPVGSPWEGHRMLRFPWASHGLPVSIPWASHGHTHELATDIPREHGNSQDNARRI